MSRRWLVAISLVAHLTIVIGVFVHGIWRIERLPGEHRYLRTLGVMLPIPEPSGGPIVATPKPFVAKQVPVAKGPRQPHPQDIKPVVPEIGTGSGSGSGSGSAESTSTCHDNCGEDPPADPVCGNRVIEGAEECDDGNQRDGDGCSSSCRNQAALPPPVPPTARITSGALRSLRLEGETQVHPSSLTQSQMMRDGATRVEAHITLCLDTSGNVASTVLTQSTKYDAYDRALLAAIRGWRYRPYMIDRTPVPACSTVNFVYSIGR